MHLYRDVFLLKFCIHPLLTSAAWVEIHLNKTIMNQYNLLQTQVTFYPMLQKKGSRYCQNLSCKIISSCIDLDTMPSSNVSIQISKICWWLCKDNQMLKENCSNRIGLGFKEFTPKNWGSLLTLLKCQH